MATVAGVMRTPHPPSLPGDANWKDVPAPAEAEADADADAEKCFVFPPDASTYTYKGGSPADLALPSMDWPLGISKDIMLSRKIRGEGA